MTSPPTTPPVEDPQELTTAMVALQCRTAPVPLGAAAEIPETLSRRQARKAKKQAKKDAAKAATTAPATEALAKPSTKSSGESSHDPPTEVFAEVSTQALTAVPEGRTAKHSVLPPTGPKSACDKRRSRRAMLALSLFVLILAGILQLATTTPQTRPESDGGSRANVVFSNALTGTCLAWPPDSPDKPSFVQCSDNHMFEVARPVGMENFMEPCQLAVQHYLGSHFDPNSKFTSTVLWAGDAQSAKPDDRNLLCGLQLPGPDGRPIPFKGMVAEQDQSKVWPAGTCLGIDPQSGRSTETPVPCSAQHAAEVVGTVNLRDHFPDARPMEPDQDGFLREACGRAADGYLAPVPLNATGLSVNYPLMSSASWNAGSREVPCTIGVRRGDDSWASLVGGAKEGVVIDGAAPSPAPEAPPPPAAVSTTVEATPTVAPSQEPVVASTTPTTTATTIASPAPSATSTATSSPSPSPSSSVPSASTSASASASTQPALGPPPGPATPPPESTEPAPNVINIGGIPFTLPWAAPPPP